MSFEKHLSRLNNNEEALIFDTIRKYYNISNYEISIHYERWRTHERRTGHANGYHQKAFVSPAKINKENYKNIPVGAYCYGIDFPYWIDLGTNKKKIFVVGINANREKADWRYFGKGVQEINNDV